MKQKAIPVVVVGLGSIGSRHVRLLSDLGADVTAISRRADVGDGLDLAEAVRRQPEALLVIASETANHAACLKTAEAAGHRGAVVVEKPLCMARHELTEWQPKRPFWVAYNLRYLPVIRALKAALAKIAEPVLSVQAYAGQHLGQWRPGRNVKSSSSAQASAGGGVLRDLSHELDLIAWLWGRVERVSALGGRLGDLTIDSDDCWNLLMETASGAQVSLGLNYFDNPARRFLHAVTPSTTISADLVHGCIGINGKETLFPAAQDDSYIAMWRDILSACETGSLSQSCDFAQAMETVSLIEDCEKSAHEKAWVQR